MFTSGGNILDINMKTLKYLSTVLVLLLLAFVTLSFVSAEPSGVLFAESPAVEGPGKVSPAGFSNNNLLTGAAMYTYPFQVMPGVNGLQPELFVSYTHHGATAPATVMGNGWALNENYISRQTEYTRSDTSDDYFVLNLNGVSSKLVYVASEGRYHTERESYLLISKKYTSANDKKEYWEVKTKDGTMYRFGSTKDAEQVSNLEPYVTRWYLDAIIDVMGNTISYSYVENPSGSYGVNYLNTITYGQNTISFEYGSNLVPSKKIFSQGNQIVQGGIVQSIVEKQGKDVVRKYVFKYTTQGALIFLQSIQEVGKDGTSTLPATTFQYSPVTSGWSKDDAWTLPVVLGDTKDLGVRLFDVDGDGLVDITNNGGAVYWKNTGKGFEQKTFPYAFTSNGVVDSEGHDLGVRFGDVNDDTRIDAIQLLVGQSNLKQALLNQGNGWVTESVMTLPAEVAFVEKKTEKVLVKDEKIYKQCVPTCSTSFCGIKSGSYSCDAKNAECTAKCFRYYCLSGGGEVYAIKCSKSDCGGQAVKDIDGVSCTMPLVSETKEYKDVTTYKELGYRFVDVNGDGKEDLVQGTAQSQKTWIKKSTQWVLDNTWKLPYKVYFVDGYGYDQGVQFADVNGDGLIDILEYGPYSKGLWLNTGSGWTNMPQYGFDLVWVLPTDAQFVSATEKLGTLFVDVNGDHLVDVLRSDAKSKAVWINTGTEWKKDTAWEIPGSVVFSDFSSRVIDINGDGAADILYAKNQNEKGTWINNGAGAYLLQNVVESGGKTISFSYQKMTQLDNTGSDDLADIGMSGWVVSAVTYDNGMNGEHKVIAPYTFIYKDGLYDTKDREFRGFAAVAEKRPDGHTVQHSFYQDAVRKGLEYKTELVSSSGAVLDSVEQEYSMSQQSGYSIVQLKKTTEVVTSGGQSVVKEMNYEYDSYGNPTVVMNKGDVSLSFDDKKQVFTYATNIPLWVVDKPSEVTLYDGKNNVVKRTQYYYDGQGLGKVTKGLLSSQQEFVSANGGITTSQEYDSYGNVVAAKDGKENIVKYTYDSTHTFPISVTNALGYVMTQKYDAGMGNVLSETDGNGFTTTYEYDVFGRLLKVIKPYDTSVYPTRLYEYGFDGKAPEKVVVKQREVSGKSETYDQVSVYDGFGKVVQVQRDGEKGVIVQNVFYDGLGRVVKEGNPYGITGGGEYVTAQAVAGRSYGYDGLSRVVEVKNADGSVRASEYIGSKVIETDENGNKKQYVLDGFDKILEVMEKNGNQFYVTLYTYRADDMLLKVVDDAKNSFSFTYDLLGRLVELHDPDLGVWKYTYDANSNMVEQNMNGKAITQTFDVLNRVTSKKGEGGDVVYVYDQGMKGVLGSVKIGSLEKKYTYDSRLRLTSEVQTIEGMTFDKTYTYDSMDRLVTMKDKTDGVVYTYTGQNTLNALDLNGKNMVTIASNVVGLPEKRTYGNAVVSEMTYHPQNYRLNEIKTLSGSQMPQKLAYGYDAVGNVKSISSSTNGVLTLDYDGLYRLVKAQKSLGSTPFTAVYSYNSIGNMLSATVNEKKVVFGYAGKPVHAPSSISMDGVVVEQKGCEYKEPACGANEECINNKCELKKGCIFNNPGCFSDQECINNKCELKKGCAYKNPECTPTSLCVENVCVTKQCSGSSCVKDQDLPDLVVTSFKPVTMDNGKGKAVYELGIKNVGKKTAYNVPWEILAHSLNKDKVVLVSSGSTPITEFAVGAQKMVYPVFSLPVCKFTIFAYIDPDNTVAEIDDKYNNIDFMSVDTCGSTLPPPPPPDSGSGSGDKEQKDSSFGRDVDQEYKMDEADEQMNSEESIIDEERLREWSEQQHEVPAADSDPEREIERDAWVRLYAYVRNTSGEAR